jgi:hypothetical protein
MAEEKREDWLDELFPNREKLVKEQHEKGLVFAQRYLVFFGPTADPRARDLLEHWTRAIRVQRIPRGASAQEYAAHNALREWIEGIHQQIEFASKNASSLPTRMNDV